MTLIKNDPIQRTIQSLAYTNATSRAIFVFCAVWLVVVLAGLAALIALTHLRAFSPALLLRLIVLVAVAFALSKVSTHYIVDTRPYIESGVAPLTPVTHDNGFPSNHTIIAATMTLALWWVSRRWLLVFALGTLIIMLARMGIGAHHTVDVVGSVLIALFAFFIAALLPVPAALKRSFLPPRWPEIQSSNDYDAPTQPNTVP